MSSTKKTYNKHFVKRDPKTLLFITKGDDPVPGELERTARLHSETAEQLNLEWENSGVIYTLAEDQPEIEESPKQPKEDYSVIKAMKKDDLITNLEELGLPTDGTVAILKERLIEAMI